MTIRQCDNCEREIVRADGAQVKQAWFNGKCMETCDICHGYVELALEEATQNALRLGLLRRYEEMYGRHGA
jgi:hypothetical protein